MRDDSKVAPAGDVKILFNYMKELEFFEVQ